MQWTEQKPGRHVARINTSLTITLTEEKPEKGKQSKWYSLKITSGSVPIHNSTFAQYDLKSAKSRAVIEARNFIESTMNKYRDMLEALEMADAQK